VRDLEAAKDKVMMGVERKSMVMSEEEKRMTAYHEAGHAVVSMHHPSSDPIHKATIIPRGRALGMVMRLPESDKLSYKREKMYADLAVSMGGRVAEELVFGYEKVSSGASSDIQYATKLARAMVSEWGMSDSLGPVHYAAETNDGFFARGPSPETAAAVDHEVRRLVNEALADATHILTTHRDQLNLIAEALLEYETLSGDEITTLIQGGTLKRPDADAELKKTPVKSALPSSRKPIDDAASSANGA